MHKRLLIIEDNTEDFAAIVRALGANRNDAGIRRISNGDDALEAMRGIAASGTADDLPQVILLDLNLPGTNGREILFEIKSDVRLRSIPVVVLTTSTSARDVTNCYENGANGYCLKVSDRAKFTETIHAFKRFWLQSALLPAHVEDAT